MRARVRMSEESLGKSPVHLDGQESGYLAEPPECWRCGDMSGMYYAPMGDEGPHDTVDAFVCTNCGYAHEGPSKEEDEVKAKYFRSDEFWKDHEGEEPPHKPVYMIPALRDSDITDKTLQDPHSGVKRVEIPAKIEDAVKTYGYQGAGYSGSYSSDYQSSFSSYTPYKPVEQRVPGYSRKTDRKVLEDLTEGDAISDEAFVTYEELYRSGPASALELDKTISSQKEPPASWYEGFASDQLNWLLQKDLVCKVGTGTCKIDSTEGPIWDVTGRPMKDRADPGRTMYPVLAVGTTFRAAIENFLNGVGWILSTLAIEKTGDEFSATVHTSDLQTFTAIGHAVPGGAVLTDWR